MSTNRAVAFLTMLAVASCRDAPLESQKPQEPPPSKILTRVYDTRDLLARPEFEGPDPARALIKLIQDRTTEAKWQENADSVSIKAVNGLLVVTHTKEIHDRITEIFRLLRNEH